MDISLRHLVGMLKPAVSSQSHPLSPPPSKVVKLLVNEHFKRPCDLMRVYAHRQRMARWLPGGIGCERFFESMRTEAAAVGHHRMPHKGCLKPRILTFLLRVAVPKRV